MVCDQVRLLENHLRAKQVMNPLTLSAMYLKGHILKSSGVTRGKQVFSQELINLGIFSTISVFFFQILYLIPRKLKIYQRLESKMPTDSNE